MRRAAALALCVALLMVCVAPALAGVRLEAPDAVERGQAFFVRVVSDEPMDAATLRWGDMELTAKAKPADSGFEVLAMLGTGSEATPGTGHVKAHVEGPAGGLDLEHAVRITAREYEVQRLTVAHRMVHPTKEQLERHYRERAEVKKVLANTSTERMWTREFVRPVKGIVTSRYGLRRIFNGEPRKPHGGLDLRGAKGTPVKCTAPGVVAIAANHYFAGNVVYVDHGEGVVSMYCHLSAMDVKPGQKVEAGQKIGEVGATGRVTAAHLHFGLIVLGQTVDPLPLVSN